MLAIRFNVDQLDIFFKVCNELQADTVEKREAILLAMIELGQVDGVTRTNMTKEEYTQHLAKNFGKVLVINKDNQ